MKIPSYNDSSTTGNEKKICHKEISPADIQELIKNNATFVVNIVTTWCPDCTVRQINNLPAFILRLEKAGISFYQCTVQHQRDAFITPEHQSFTESCGGHGYPRTVLFNKGSLVDSDNVEIISAETLKQLADRFTSQVQSGH